MNVEWDIPFELHTPAGVLPLNAPMDSSGEGMFLLDAQKCSAAPILRVFADDIPQADGSILHRPFKSGYIAKLGLEMWETTETPACGALLGEMWDLLSGHLNALLRPSAASLASGAARLLWTPSHPVDRRMLDKVELFEWPTPSYSGAETAVAFGLHTELPYAMDLTEQIVTIPDIFDVPAGLVVVNHGNTDFYPVWRCHGPEIGAITITNNTTGLQLLIDTNYPGAIHIPAGHYGEIDTFHGTMFLDGNGANMIAAVDTLFSEFFPLVPGPNHITYSGSNVSPTIAGADLLFNNAWA